MEDIINETRYDLYVKRALIQAHLEIIDTAIEQHNRFIQDTDLCYTAFRNNDLNLFDKYMRAIEEMK
jgi:hypothetical protein